jgi:hypothetical protein
MPVVRRPFTSGDSGFFGTYPYFAMPNPQPPSVRSQALPPVTAPAAPQPYGRTKAALPPSLTATYQAAAIIPGGPTTYAVGSGVPLSGRVNT